MKRRVVLQSLLVVVTALAIGACGSTPLDSGKSTPGGDGGVATDAPNGPDGGQGDGATPAGDSGYVAPLYFSYVRHDVPGMVFPDAIAVGDLDGDGRSDVAVTASRWSANALEPRVFLLHGERNGDLTLVDELPIPHGSQADVQIADVTGDARADLLVAAPPGILLYAQDANGHLAAPVALEQPGGAAGIRVLRVGDVNGDGRADVFALQNDHVSRVLVYLQRSTGGLAPAVASDTRGYLDAAIGELTGDGRVDVVALDGFGNAWVSAQLADGTFAYPTALEAGTAPFANAVGAGDLNGDGLDDAVVAFGGSKLDAQLSVLLQNTPTPVRYPSLDGANAVHVFDADGDGRKDIVVSHGAFHAFGLYLQRADGSLADEETFPYPGEGVHTNRFAVGDVTGDGKADLTGAVEGAVLVAVRQR